MIRAGQSSRAGNEDVHCISIAEVQSCIRLKKSFILFKISYLKN